MRQSKDLMVIELAFATRIHPSQLSAIERRKLAASTRVKEALCSFFCVSEKEAFDEDGLAV
jgi:hypothetical protein